MKSIKTTLIIFSILSGVVACSHKKVVSVYFDYFSEKIELRADSTFSHTYRFDLASSWTDGTWSIQNDTIYLSTKLVLDTVRIPDTRSKILKDTLVLSQDKNVDRIGFNEYLLELISSGGQYRVKPTKKLFFSQEKLYRIKEDETLDMEAHAPLSNPKKKYQTYFQKETGRVTKKIH